MTLDDVLDDGQAQPGAAEPARGRVVDLDELLEQGRQLVAGDADASVGHRQAQTARGPAREACRDRALGGELDGVGHQIAEDLADSQSAQISLFEPPSPRANALAQVKTQINQRIGPVTGWQLVAECKNCFDQEAVESTLANVLYLNPPRTWAIRAKYDF